MLIPILQATKGGGCCPAPEILRKMMAASSEGRRLWRRSSMGWLRLEVTVTICTGLWAGLRLECSSRESCNRRKILAEPYNCKLPHCFETANYITSINFTTQGFSIKFHSQNCIVMVSWMKVTSERPHFSLENRKWEHLFLQEIGVQFPEDHISM